LHLASERLIHQAVTEAAGHFDANGRIADNRLAEVEGPLVEAAGLANALLGAGECLR
jgi:hypothetical protein